MRILRGARRRRTGVAAAKADMDKVMADRDAEIAAPARTDGTSVPVNAVATPA